MAIKQKLKICKGTGEAKDYGCGNEKPIFSHGLCRYCYAIYNHKTKEKKVKKPKKKLIKLTHTEKIVTIKQLNKRLDDAWSKKVKVNAGFKCEYCGKPTTLNSHHIYSRGIQRMRWSEDNGICLCVKHHIGLPFSAHKTPIPFATWITKYRGEKVMNSLLLQSKRIKKLSRTEKELILKSLRQ